MKIERELKKYIRLLDSFMNYDDMLEKDDLPLVCNELDENLKNFKETLDETNEVIVNLKNNISLLESSNAFLKNFRISIFKIGISRLSISSNCFEKAISKTNECLIKLNWKVAFSK